MQNRHIQFTIEHYEKTGILLLDTMNVIGPNGPTYTSVYRKSTHLDRYLHFTSYHPTQHKVSVAKTLY